MSAFSFRAGRRAALLNFFTSFLVLFALLPAPSASAAGKFSTVVIDAGHGGFDRGGIPGQRVAEKAMALDVAQRLKTRLRKEGYRVVMTRDSDLFVSLGERARIANGYRDAIFVSVHFNSATRVGANGIETYYYSSNSAQLAANIHRHVVAGTTTENRGIRQRGYFVLRRTSIPAVLVECGFLTNPDEARMALQSSYRERLADKIADGVMGKPTPPNRPVVAGVTHVTAPIRQPFKDYYDFVRAEPDRRPTHRSSRSSKKSSSKKSTSKKSSSSSKKKSSSSSKKKSTKKKKKAGSDE
ncbi:MAG: N-acetylmuramoyl-L-alanine amidase [Verrucomicrobiota bacterium]|nr:N-acetylmuramoyl-L-alanine amidase [Verrucomicrobiota bacterium]